MNIKIGVAGKIASGKTTAARAISQHFSCPIVSFGDILREFSIQKGLPCHREALQKLGQKTIDDLGYSRFLDWVIKNSPQIKWEDSLVVDGFRHFDIYRCFAKIFSRSLLVYCSCDENLQLKRLMERDKIDKRHALNIISHPTEQKVEQLRQCADVILEGGMEINQLIACLDSLL